MADVLLLPGPRDEQNSDRCASFIEPAPLIDVLFDQLEYLVLHNGHSCPDDCPDCDRLEKIKTLLLAPFDSPHRPETPAPLAA
jgi:hypothetical protein